VGESIKSSALGGCDADRRIVMSEPSSLYMRVRLTAKNLEAFKNSLLIAPSHYTDWQPWLHTRTYYGEITDAEIQGMEFSEVLSVGEYLSLLLQDVYASPSQARYDIASNTWTLCVMELSENYKDFILVLSILRGIAAYKDTPGEDFIIIYPYLWTDNSEMYVDAYVTLTTGNSQMVNEIPAEAITEANQMLGKHQNIGGKLRK